MMLAIPEIKDATVTSITFTPSRSIKKIFLETAKMEVDLSNVNLDANAEIIINRVIPWGERQ